MRTAVVTDTGEVCPGAVVENVSLGLAMCAERVALFSTVAVGADNPVALELGGRELRIVVADPDGTSTTSYVRTLLPAGPHKPKR